MYELIPNELKCLNNWVCWKAEPDPKSHSGISKKPINPKTGGYAMSNNPETWSDFDTAVRMSDNYAGIGFMFSNSGYFGVDLDDIGGELKDYFSGKTDNIVGEFVDTLRSYTELSQSKHGVHIICKGTLPEGSRRKGKVEMYDSGRFFVMTGNYCSEYMDVTDCTETVKPLHQKYLSAPKQAEREYSYSSAPVNLNIQSIIEKAKNSLNGDKFSRLYSGDISEYGSQSEADMAFCNMLAFWCGGDIEKMDIIYRSSGLMREKWERRQSGSTYGMLTLQKAVSQCDNYYGQNIQTAEKYGISIGRETEEKISLKLYSFDDTGNAQRLVDACGDVLKYSYVDKRWLFYKDGKWTYDNIGHHRGCADYSVYLMKNELKRYQQMDEDEGTDMEKKFMKHLNKSRSYTGKTNMLKEAEHYLPVVPSALDKNKYLFNCKNGTIDLTTCKLLPHSKDDYITKIANCSYNSENNSAPLWKQFLSDIFGGDKDLIRYVQKAVGYSLSGSTAEQCAFFLYGTGRNGKSTFLEMVRCIMGDYATNIQPQTIMVKPTSSGGANSDIARLKGSRFVTSVEPNEGMRIDEGLLKQLTGDDVVTARKLFGDEFEFKPEFKLWMATNHKPVIRGTDTGIWRRIHLIPFEVQIPEDKIDRHLKFKLAKEMEGILNWAIEGFRLWQTEGLNKPKAVIEAIEGYHHEMDVISAFFDSCCKEGGEVKASQLYAVYAKWADENNEYKMSSTKFGIEMAKRYDKYRVSDGVYYRGISVGAESYSVSIG